MSNVAFGTDEKLHYADDFHDKYKGEYFCPNENCRTKMILKNVGFDEKASKKILPYFSATVKFPHCEDCEYKETSLSGADLSKSGFKFDDFFKEIIKFEQKSNQKSISENNNCLKNTENNFITTVNKLYKYCLQHDDNLELPGGHKIFEIYQEKRNESVSNESRNSKRLVKLRFSNCQNKYDDKNNCYKIWCYFPHTENSVPPANWVTLGFADVELKNYYNERLSALKNRDDVYIVVCGEWHEMYKKSLHCDIKSRKQIIIISKK